MEVDFSILDDLFGYDAGGEAVGLKFFWLMKFTSI